jgi:hypothetical protein
MPEDTVTLGDDMLVKLGWEIMNIRGTKKALTTVEDEKKLALRGALKPFQEEFPGVKKFQLPGLTISLSDNWSTETAVMLEYLIKNNVDPRLIERAKAAAKKENEPRLNIRAQAELVVGDEDRPSL